MIIKPLDFLIVNGDPVRIRLNAHAVGFNYASLITQIKIVSAITLTRSRLTCERSERKNNWRIWRTCGEPRFAKACAPALTAPTLRRRTVAVRSISLKIGEHEGRRLNWRGDWASKIVTWLTVATSGAKHSWSPGASYIGIVFASWLLFFHPSTMKSRVRRG